MQNAHKRTFGTFLFSVHFVKMPKCCATDCENEGVHKFPKEPIRRELWEKALRIPDFKAQQFSSLCTKHFKEDDYFGGKSLLYDYYAHITKILKRTAVPSLFHYNHYNIKPKDPSVNFQLKHLISHPQSVAVSDDTSNLTAEIPFLKIINVTSMRKISPIINNEGGDVDNKSEIIDEKQINDKIKIEFETICRTCLSENAIMSLTENCDDGCTLGAMLEKIADVSIEVGLPNVICSTCAEDLRFAIAFRRRAQLADKTLRLNSLYTSVNDDAATDLLSSLKVKQEPPPCDLFETTFPDNSSNFESKETINVFKRESEHAAPSDNSLFNMDYNSETDVMRQQVVEIPFETYNTVHNSSSDKNISSPCELLTQETNLKRKPTNNQQVIKLKAIDQTQIPVNLLRKVQSIKLRPNVLTELNQNPSTKVSDESYLIEMKPKKATNIKTVEKPLRKKVYVAKQPWKSETNKEQSNKPQSTCEKIKCSVCGLVLLNKPAYDLHIQRHGRRNRPFICPNQGCELSFTSYKLLSHHKNTSHPPDHRLFICLTCGKKCHSRLNALNHLQLHKVEPGTMNRKKNMFQCELCGFLGSFEIQLLRHMRQKHPGEKPYRCTDCDKRFLSKYAMKYHKKRTCRPTVVNDP